MMIVNCKSQDIPYVERTDILNRYFTEIRKYELIEYKDECQLIMDAQQNEDIEKRDKAIEKLVCCNQRFVISVAKKMTINDNLLDLISEGNIGLIEAIKRFDVNKKCHFVTYAVWWIKKNITAYLTNKQNAVVPANAPKIYHYSNAVREDFIKEHERSPQLYELKELIKERYNFNVENLRDLESFQSVSIDEHYGGDSDEDTIEDSRLFSLATSSNNVEDDIYERDNNTIVNELLSKLKPREQYILKAVYGIGCEERTMDDIALEFDLSKERIRQITNSSIKKLQNISGKENI